MSKELDQAKDDLRLADSLVDPSERSVLLRFVEMGAAVAQADALERIAGSLEILAACVQNTGNGTGRFRTLP